MTFRKMKRFISAIQSLLSVMMLSFMFSECTSDTVNGVGGEDVTKITVALPQTRTMIGNKVGNTYLVYWSEGDRIVADGLLSEVVEIDADDRSRATFAVKGSISYPLSVTYPYSSATTATVPIVEFLSEQNHTEGTFAEGSVPMCGYITEQGRGCSLKHLAGVLRFSVKASSEGIALQKVVVTSTTGAKLSGEFEVNCETASIEPTERTQSTITYVLPTDFQLPTNDIADFFIPMPAVVPGSCTVEFIEPSGEKMVCRWSSSSAVKSGVVKEFKPLTYERQKSTTLEGVELPSFSGEEGGKLFRTRAMTYNVRNCKGTDGVIDYKRVADVISEHNVEVVALQELDSMTTRYPGQDVLKNLADHTGMYPTFSGSIEFRGGKYGVGILTKEEPLSCYRIPLPCSSEPRSFLVVELENYYFCCTHFSLSAEYREQAVDIIVAEATKLDKPVIIAGDLNATRSEAEMVRLSRYFYIFEKFDSPNTYPSSEPKTEIDYICLYKGRMAEASVMQHFVPVVPTFSDHRPVVIDVTICE